MAGIDFALLRGAHSWAIDAPGYPLTHDFPLEEYRERVGRARTLMAAEGFDALIITTGMVGQWFTSQREPHEWHDQCTARSAWYILTHDQDLLLMTATAGGEHFNTTRRSTWVSRISGIVERNEEPRWEIWDLRQIPLVLEELRVAGGRLGFELGDCMSLGLSVNDFLRLRTLLPRAQLDDASPLIRKLMSVHTELEIQRLRLACEAGIVVHDMVSSILKPAMTERMFLDELARDFRDRFSSHDYAYQPAGGWDVRNSGRTDSNSFHAEITDRVFQVGDVICRSRSGASYRGYHADIDRMWSIGAPSDAAKRWYRIAWECNRAMAEVIRPGTRCADIYWAGNKVEKRFGLGDRPGGRTGHGYRNTGGLSVHPDNPTILEPGMIISVEPMFANEHGYFDLEDQYLVTANGAECLHALAPESIVIIQP